MGFKTGAIIGLGVGYYIGAKAGRERYEQMNRWAEKAKSTDAYNAAARIVMTDLGIPINDLHAVISADCGTLLSEDQLHLSEAGQQACAARRGRWPG